MLGYRVSSGFIGGSKPRPLPPEVIEIEETQQVAGSRPDAEGTCDSIAPHIALALSNPPVPSLQAFPMQIPLHYNGKSVQTDPPHPSPGPSSRITQATQTDQPMPSKLRKMCTAHAVHYASSAPCTPHVPHGVHYSSCAPCTLHVPHGVHYSSCAPCTPHVPHGVHYDSCAPCTAKAPSNRIDALVNSQALVTNSIEPSKITINGHSLEDIIQKAREDGYKEAMGHVANKMEDVFGRTPSDCDE
jgi:hypothetical protein